MGIGDWGLGIGPNPQSPIPNPQSPIPNPHVWFIIIKFYAKLMFKKIKINKLKHILYYDGININSIN